jgi:hypothetical protein
MPRKNKKVNANDADDSKIVMSVSIDPQLKDAVEQYSKRKGMSNSAYICSLIEPAIKLNVDDEVVMIGQPADSEVTPIILKVPNVYKSNPDKLKQWLDIQSAGIVKAVTKQVESKA